MEHYVNLQLTVILAQWSLDEVMMWAKGLVGEDNSKKLRDQETNGGALLKMDVFSFVQRCGLTVGDALHLAKAVAELKRKQPGMCSHFLFELSHFVFITLSSFSFGSCKFACSRYSLTKGC